MASPEDLERRDAVALVIEDYLAKNKITSAELARRASTPSSAVRALIKKQKGIGVKLAQKLINAGIDESALLTAAGFGDTAHLASKDGPASGEDLPPNARRALSRIAKKLLKLPESNLLVIEDAVDGMLKRNNSKKNVDDM